MKSKVNTLLELYNFIMIGKNTMEDLYSEDNNIECTFNQVYQDADLDEFLDSINANVISIDDCKYIISDNVTTVSIKCEDFINRHGEDLPDETIIFMDTMELIV